MRVKTTVIDRIGMAHFKSTARIRVEAAGVEVLKVGWATSAGVQLVEQSWPLQLNV